MGNADGCTSLCGSSDLLLLLTIPVRGDRLTAFFPSFSIRMGRLWYVEVFDVHQ